MIPRLLPLVIGVTTCASAFTQTLVNDDFSAVPANNPNNVGWYSSAGTVATFNTDTGSLQFTSGDTTNNAGVFKQFSQTTLAVGQVIEVTFDYTAFAAQPTTVTNNHFRIGLFDTSDTFTSNQGASPWTTPNRGYQMAIGTGAATAQSNFFYRANQTNLVSTTGSTAQGTADVIQLNTTALPATVRFSISRDSDTTITLNGSFTQGGVTSTFTSKTATVAVDTFDTLYIGNGLNVNGRSFSIDNVSVAVVPEPSTAALAALGFAGLAFMIVNARRRRTLVL